MHTKPKFNLLTILAILLVFVVLVFYIALKDTTEDVSGKAPYHSIIGQQIRTVEDAILIHNETSEFSKDYPYELLEIQRMDTTSMKYTTIHVGATLVFYKAIQVNHAVSGCKYVYLLGEVIDQDKISNKPIIYHWATFKSICIDTPCNYWEHKKAPWQTEIDTQRYF